MDIIQSNDTPIAKAKSFLVLVEREIALSHGKKDGHDVTARTDEFDNEGINIFILNLSI